MKLEIDVEIKKTTNPHLGEVIQVGGDTLEEYDLEHLISTIPTDRLIKKLVYHYDVGAWSGDGVAVYLDSKDEWHIDNLGHCSCYGPFDGGFNKISYTKEQVLELLRSSDYNYDWEENKPGGKLVAAMLEGPTEHHRPNYYTLFTPDIKLDPSKHYDFLIECFAYGFAECDTSDVFEAPNSTITKDGIWKSENGMIGCDQQISHYRETEEF